MKDLYRCLDEYSPQLLQAIAEAWQVALPKGAPRDMVRGLAAAMLAPGALEGLLSRLTPEACEALAGMVRAGGISPAHRLFRGYGAIRRLGPARLARERPWLQPANALEELLYKGLSFRAYGTVEDYYGEVLLIPQQLQERLDALRLGAAALVVQEVEAPTKVKADGQALAEDMLAILVRVRQGQVAAGPAGNGGERASATPSLASLDLGPRLQGESHAERLALIGRMLARMHLVQSSEGLLRPTARAREWLRAADFSRLQSVYLAWREDMHWDELRHLSVLHLDDPAWQGHPVRVRRALAKVLGQVRPGVWLSLDSFIATLKRQRPDYLRPDGDYDHPAMRDAQTGERLSGFESWERIEGALARYLIAWPLRWLGVVDIGYDDGEQPSALRLSAEGWALLSEGAEPVAGAATPPPLATIAEDFTVTLPLVGSLYERYQLERFAQWQAQDNARAVYRISAESIWKSQNAGVKVEQILHFLRRISQDQVPSVVARALQEWGHRFGKVIIRKTVLLQAVDRRTMQRISSEPTIRALLGEMLSPTTCLVDERNVEALSKQLKALGIWPHVSL